MIRGFIALGILFGFESIDSQNINLYLNLLENGRIEEVKDNLPELLDRYSNEPGVYFIQALVNQDGESSLEQFQSLSKTFPDSKYALRSEIKVGEYLFARGLYSQSSAQFKKIIYKYVDLEYHQRVLDLMVNSYLATGEQDSVVLSLRTIKQLYPSLDFDKYGINGLDKPAHEGRLVRLNPGAISERFKSRKVNLSKNLFKNSPKPWVVQVGAFGKYENANRLKKQIQGHGYAAEVHVVNSNGKRLHAVRIVRFKTKVDGEKIGKALKKKFGLDFRVINNPV